MSSISDLPATFQPFMNSLASDGLAFSLFGLSFKTPITFSGGFQLTTQDDYVLISGQATIGQPFNVTVDGVTLKITKTDEITFKFAPTFDLAGFVQAQVQPKVDSTTWSVLNTVLMPYLKLFTDPAIILANNENEDEDLGSYVKGFNVYATMNPAQIQPFKALADTFDKGSSPVLNLASKKVILHVGTESASAEDFVLEGTLDLDTALGTKVVVLHSLGMETAKKETEISVEGICTLLLKATSDQTLTFIGGVEAESSGAVSLYASLSSDNGSWKNPFGIHGVTITGLGIQITAAAEFPWVGLGLRGGVDLGGALPDAEFAFLFDPSQPEAFIIQIASAKGLNLKQLLSSTVNLSASTSGSLVKIPLSTYVSSIFDLSLTNVNFYLSPTGGTIAHKTYEKGFALSGELDLWGYKASIDSEIDYDKGGYIKGSMDAINLHAGGLTFFALTAADGKGNPNVDIEFNLVKHSASISAKLALLNGLYSQMANISISSSGFTFQTDTSGGFGIYGGAKVTIDKSTGFSMTATPTVGFSTSIAGHSLTLQAQTTISSQINKQNAFAQSIAASVNAFGATKSLGPVSYTIPVNDATAAANVVKQFFENDFKNFFTQTLAAGAKAAFDWVKSNVTSDAAEAEKMFETVGASSTNIAHGLVNTFGKTPDQAVAMISSLKNDSKQCAAVLKDLGASSDDVAGYLKSTYNLSEDAVKSALSSAGYVASDIGKSLDSAFKKAGSALNPSKW